MAFAGCICASGNNLERQVPPSYSRIPLYIRKAPNELSATDSHASCCPEPNEGLKHRTCQTPAWPDSRLEKNGRRVRVGMASDQEGTTRGVGAPSGHIYVAYH
jgi:hypothetical protein